MRSIFVLLSTQMGSLHAFGMTRLSRAARKWIGGSAPSADTLGRVASLVEPNALRACLVDTHRRLKRGKAFSPSAHGKFILVLDAHESHSSYQRCCSACLTREVGQKDGPKKTQYYHRYVAAVIVGKDFVYLADLESQRDGDGEITTARRLYDRVHKNYSRSYDIVAGDALYADTDLLNAVVRNRKDFVVVLKDNRPTLVAETKRLRCDVMPTFSNGAVIHDLPSNNGWPDLEASLRIVTSQETKTRTRQRDGKKLRSESNWMWATSIPTESMSANTIAQIGHQRWAIENEGFNVLVNRWCADHVYKHEAQAFENFLILTFLAFNIFQVFFHRNLKPQRRARTMMSTVERQVASGIDADAFDDTS